MKKLIVFLVMLAAFACKTQQPPVVIDRERIVVKDSIIPFYISPDSALLEAWLECDSAGRVLLSAVNSETTRRMMAEFKLEQNKLTYKARTPKDSVLIRNKYFAITREKTTYVPRDVPAEIPWWMRLSSAIGLLTIGFVAIKVIFIRKLPRSKSAE